MQPFERDRQELCVMQKTRQTEVTLLKKSKCCLIENCEPKSGWPRPAFSAHACRERVQDEKLVYCITL